jgi:hypothetical protein
MSEYRVINGVNATLRDLLWVHFQADTSLSGTSGILADENKISFEAPYKLVKEESPDQNVLSIFLYRVVENPEMKNRSLLSAPNHRQQLPPLGVNLFYLITPITNSSDNDHRLLGKTMQVLYDNAILAGSLLKTPLLPATDELRLIFNPAPLEDLVKLWGSFIRSYRLSVSYEIKVVFIDSERTLTGEPVRQKHLDFDQVKVP